MDRYIKYALEIIKSSLGEMKNDDKIEVLNCIKTELHEIGPFKNEPTDCVLWVKSANVVANDYNPNVVAIPEMELLEHSIECDGYTQPIVSWPVEDHYEVVDGFHRSKIGKESKLIDGRLNGYLPITIIKSDRSDRSDRIAATIRHNRARGKHEVSAMSDIVVELKRRNWTDKRIGKELGMDEDEILRLTQITGLAEMFADREFSNAWEINKINEDDNLEDIITF